MNSNQQSREDFIWEIADILRGDFRQFEYGKIILPMTVIRRLDCVLDASKEHTLEKYIELSTKGIEDISSILCQISGQNFFNLSSYTFNKLIDDPTNIANNLRDLIDGFSTNAREIIDSFNFSSYIDRLESNGLLYQIVKRFAEVDLHPSTVSNLEMGYIFEGLIRRFSEQSHQATGEHFTPREVIELMVNLLFVEDDGVLRKENMIRSLYDPSCGTGGMLFVADKYIKELYSKARLELFGQELNPESYAICKADMLLREYDATNIKIGNSLNNDGLKAERFDYMLSNPPYGVGWKKAEKDIRREYKEQEGGRFVAGLPRINDGSFLFLQHMLSKMKSVDKGGSRLAVVFNGSPLFAGQAGSGESNIRKWIIEHDWLEAVIALPDRLFYNTGIFTYVWILSNRKAPPRQGKIQLINATSYFSKMRKSLGNKRHQMQREEHIQKITEIYGKFAQGENCKIFDNEEFGYYRITVERPLRLNFQLSEERIANINDIKLRHKAYLTEDALLEILKANKSEKIFKNKEEFTKHLKELLTKNALNLSPTLEKNLINALSQIDETADIYLDKNGNPQADQKLRDYENIPLKQNIDDYFASEVLPYTPDAWIDTSKTKIGYEISFSRCFYQHESPRSLEEIEAELEILEREIIDLLRQE